METRGLCGLGPPPKGALAGSEPLLQSIARSASEYLHHERWQHTAAAAEEGATAGGLPPLTVTTVYRPSEAQWPLFPCDRKAVYDEAAALRILHTYIDKCGALGGDTAISAEGCKGNVQVKLDAMLADALFSGQVEAKPAQLSLGEVRYKWVGRLETWTRLAGGGLAKASLRPGKSPSLMSVRTQMRRGHKVTVVSGMSALGIDERKLAADLQVVVGAAATVKETPVKDGPSQAEVVLQGLWDRLVVEQLSKKHGVPTRMIENRAAGRRGMQQPKMKTATNILKA
eukprot:scaffold143108_cov32-Tisochrysis_lutea.AAC.4